VILANTSGAMDRKVIIAEKTYFATRCSKSALKIYSDGHFRYFLCHITPLLFVISFLIKDKSQINILSDSWRKSLLFSMVNRIRLESKILSTRILQESQDQFFFRQDSYIERMAKESCLTHQEKQESGKNDVKNFD
jgi:hypothetical protein